jgi:hypothetical protein
LAALNIFCLLIYLDSGLEAQRGGTGCYRWEFFLAGRLSKLSDPLLPAMEYSLAWVAFSAAHVHARRFADFHPDGWIPFLLPLFPSDFAPLRSARGFVRI